MSDSLLIRVHYPLESGSLVLRTEQDWTKDRTPDGVNAERTRFDFELPLNGRHCYFKPLLRRDGAEHWAQGDNTLALPNGHRERDVYPHFFAESHCHTCTLHEVGAKTDDRDHALRVFYPPGYEENALERYPVIYMQDGQNLFFPDEAFAGHHWMIEETLKVLDSMNLIRKAIVVGVYPRDRMAEYTMPGYAAYGRYLVEDVKPWVDATFRTLNGPRHTAVMGSSLGGVVSLHLAWQWPQVFGHAGCLSSTFGYRDDLFERVAAEEKRRIRIYLDSGWPQDNYEVTRSMRNLLLKKGYVPGKDLLYLAFPRASHNEQAWAMRAHIPFQHFFST